MRIALRVVSCIVLLGFLLVGPLLEPLVLAPALRNREAEWAPGVIHGVGRIMEYTGRRDRARELYETELYFAYRGDEAVNPGLAELVAYKYSAQDDPDAWAAFIPWRTHPYRVRGEPAPAWIGGPGARPHPRLARVLLDLAEIYEDRREYTPMRHIHHALRHCFEAGVFTDPEARAELEEVLKDGPRRSY